MESNLKYKNYTGSIEYSSVDGVWCGKILDINDLISYEASLREDLQKAFIDAVQDYTGNS